MTKAGFVELHEEFPTVYKEIAKVTERVDKLAMIEWLYRVARKWTVVACSSE